MVRRSWQTMIRRENFREYFRGSLYRRYFRDHAEGLVGRKYFWNHDRNYQARSWVKKMAEDPLMGMVQRSWLRISGWGELKRSWIELSGRQISKDHDWGPSGGDSPDILTERHQVSRWFGDHSQGSWGGDTFIRLCQRISRWELVQSSWQRMISRDGPKILPEDRRWVAYSEDHQVGRRQNGQLGRRVRWIRLVRLVGG
jgi:hypothetical protein